MSIIFFMKSVDFVCTDKMPVSLKGYPGMCHHGKSHLIDYSEWNHSYKILKCGGLKFIKENNDSKLSDALFVFKFKWP